MQWFIFDTADKGNVAGWFVLIFILMPATIAVLCFLIIQFIDLTKKLFPKGFPMKEFLKFILYFLLMAYATHLIANTGYLDSPKCIHNP